MTLISKKITLRIIYLKNKEWKYKQLYFENFSFNTYMDSINFVVSLAEIAEQQNHHPDI